MFGLFNAIAPWEKTNGKHPTQKPLALLTRLILMASDESSLICDPLVEAQLQALQQIY